MEEKTNILTISFAFLTSIFLHLFILFSLGNFTFKFPIEVKNKITINLSAIGNIETKVKNQYYLIKGNSDENNDQLDRKRSNKRRRKIRKPVKGLR